MKILTKPQTFQKPLGSNISLPCSVLNLGESLLFMAIVNDLVEIHHENWIRNSRQGTVKCFSQTMKIAGFQINFHFEKKRS